MSPIGMNFVTGRAGNLVFHMTALEASHVRRLVQVTTEADLVCGDRGQLTGILDIRGRGRFRMFLPRTVTRFTRSPCEPMSLFHFDGIVRTFLKSLENIFMAGSAKFRARVAGRKRSLSYPAEGCEK